MVFFDANARSCNSSAHALRGNREATQYNVFAAFRTLNLCAALYLTRAYFLGCASKTLEVIKYDLCAACYQRLALTVELKKHMGWPSWLSETGHNHQLTINFFFPRLATTIRRVRKLIKHIGGDG